MGFLIDDPYSHEYGTNTQCFASFFENPVHIESNQGENGTTYIVTADYSIWTSKQARDDGKTPIAIKSVTVPDADPAVSVYAIVYAAAKAQWNSTTDHV
jgi:hypothetical protein